MCRNVSRRPATSVGGLCLHTSDSTHIPLTRAAIPLMASKTATPFRPKCLTKKFRRSFMSQQLSPLRAQTKIASQVCNFTINCKDVEGKLLPFLLRLMGLIKLMHPPFVTEGSQLVFHCGFRLLRRFCRAIRARLWRFLRRLLQGFDREGDAFGFAVDAEHLYFDDLACFYRLRWILDIAGGEFADVHKSILVNTDIDERAKLRHVGDNSFEHHIG